jgi:dienelactone hydrolase
MIIQIPALTATAALLLASMLAALDTRAAVVESVIDVPVSVRDMAGKKIDHIIKVTVFHDDKREKSPWLVINHGRPSKPEDFVRMARQRYATNSQYFVSKGFAVFVPTRVGYGVTGGDDVEFSGPCNARSFATSFAAVADQTLAVLQAARKLPFVDPSRGVVVGQSVGGMTSVALAARDVPGLVATVNFAGGGGGDPEKRPADPCSEPRLRALFKEYGAAAKVPALWMYSQNDRFWGRTLPRDWFDEYMAAGGRGRFVPLPAYRADGHGIFSGDPDAWKEPLEAFLKDVGF